MLSMLFWAVGMVLHAGEAVTGLEYGYRVLVHLVAFAVLGGTLLGSIKLIELVDAGRGRSGGPDDDR